MIRLLVVLPLVLLIGCGAHMRNMPIERGRTQLHASVGGPLVNAFGMTVPVPYAMGGITFGLTDRVNVYSDLHVTAAAYKFLGITPGIALFPRLPLRRCVPALNADLLIFSDFKESRVFPEVTLSAALPLDERWTPYAGLHCTMQTTKQPALIPSVYAGTSWRAGRARIFAEVQWLALNHSNHFTPVDYHGIGERGALAPQVGLSFDLGRRPQ